ncbi:MAG: SEC-C metal-binding domain-containing protein, partial [Candidatus Dormibacteraceae bacterium]
VMNKQREIIYSERTRVLDGVDTRDNILEYIHEVIATGVEGHCQGRSHGSWDLDGLLEYLRQYFPLAEGTEIPEEALRGGTEGLVEYLYDAAVLAYEAKEADLGEDLDLRRQVERFVMLRTIDSKWVDYLTQMEHFREGVGLQAYGQRDPLQEYKIEAHKMFDELTASIRADVVANMFRVQVMAQEPPPQAERVDHDSAQGAEATGTVEREGRPRREKAAVGGGHKIGRNEPCPCGSGKKYKYCHGR